MRGPPTGGVWVDPGADDDYQQMSRARTQSLILLALRVNPCRYDGPNQSASDYNVVNGLHVSRGISTFEQPHAIDVGIRLPSPRSSSHQVHPFLLEAPV